jgi:hypothetical protein
MPSVELELCALVRSFECTLAGCCGAHEVALVWLGCVLWTLCNLHGSHHSDGDWKGSDATTVRQTHLDLRCAQWSLWHSLPRLNGAVALASFASFLNIVVFSVSCSLSSIYHGVNFYGDTCGSDAQSDRPYNAWVAMPGSTPESLGRADDCTDCFFIKTCLASCNDTLSAPEMIDLYPTTKFGYFCVPDTEAFVQGEVHVQFSYSGDFATVQQNAARAMGDLYSFWLVMM